LFVPCYFLVKLGNNTEKSDWRITIKPECGSNTETNRKTTILSSVLPKLHFYAPDVSLQKLKESSGVRSVHLRVMELERDG